MQRTLMYSAMIAAARSTLDGGDGDAYEFMRGMAALIVRANGLTDDDMPAVYADFRAEPAIISAARDLRSVDGENPEYDRALSELVQDVTGIPKDTAAEMISADDDGEPCRHKLRTIYGTCSDCGVL